MAITPNPNDKYAFLFSGPTDDRFLKDLENVAQTLVEYYNYPLAHMMVVLGSVPAVLPGFSGVAVTTIASALDLDAALATFAAMAAGANKTALFYFTGGGIAPAEGTTASQLAITGGVAPASVDAAWLAARLNSLGAANVNVVMQQSYAGGISAALTGSALADWSFTFACGADEESYGDFPVVKGSYFTHAWTRALKLEALPPGTGDAGAYADELGGGAEGGNRLVSLQEAMAFAWQIHDGIDGMGGFSTPGYTGPVAGGAQYLGLPQFLIRDGNPWWESPDIDITHPNHPWVPAGDLFIPDAGGAVAPYNNTIRVRVRNTGSHPVRAFALGVEFFQTGAGGPSVQHDADPVLPAGSVLRPMDAGDAGTLADQVVAYEWNTLFDGPSTHRCVKAEARLLHAELDFAWNVQANDYEGQRNIDEMAVVPLPPEPLFPEIQGWKEHLFGVQNRFKETMRFRVAVPKEFLEWRERLGLEWFELVEGKERVPIKIEEEPWPHMAFLLKPKQGVDLRLRLRLGQGAKLEKPLRLPFEVWAEGTWRVLPRRLFFPIRQRKLAPVAGFTVVVRTGWSALAGRVVDEGGRPVPEVRVRVSTVDGEHGAATWTNRYGEFEFRDINPNVYHLWAEGGQQESERLTVVLLDGAVEKVELRLK